jgi:hypothetical protein
MYYPCRKGLGLGFRVRVVGRKQKHCAKKKKTQNPQTSNKSRTGMS